MSVSGISSVTSSLDPTGWRSTVKQGKQDFSKLLGALQSGDVPGAQQAYSAMQQLLPGLQAAAGAIKTDFSALGTALSSGTTLLDAVNNARRSNSSSPANAGTTLLDAINSIRKFNAGSPVNTGATLLDAVNNVRKSHSADAIKVSA